MRRFAAGRVSDGIRTRDRLDHNQELYRLSYAHQALRSYSRPQCPREGRDDRGLLESGVHMAAKRDSPS